MISKWLYGPKNFPGLSRNGPLTGDTVLCSWARHSTLTVPLSTQEYKWVPANCWGNLINYGEVTCDGLASRPRGVEILLAASCYRNRNKLSSGSYEPVLAPRLHFVFYNDHQAIGSLRKKMTFYLRNCNRREEQNDCHIILFEEKQQ